MLVLSILRPPSDGKTPPCLRFLRVHFGGRAGGIGSTSCGDTATSAKRRETIGVYRAESSGLGLVTFSAGIAKRSVNTARNRNANSAAFCLTARQTPGFYRTESSAFAASQQDSRSELDLQLFYHKETPSLVTPCDGQSGSTAKAEGTASQGQK